MDDLLAFVKRQIAAEEEDGAGAYISTEVATALKGIVAEYERVAGSAARYPGNATLGALGVMQAVLMHVGSIWADQGSYRPTWRPPGGRVAGRVRPRVP